MALTTLRTNIVNQAEWVLAHGSQWHYEEVRPIPIAAIKAGRLPLATDCSGSVIGIYARAGAHDPSGYNYAGYGNTESLYSHCEHLESYTDCEPGDMVDVGTAADGGSTHVYLVLKKTATDLVVFSHGGPNGVPPKTENLSAVKDYWYSSGYHFTGLRGVPAVEKAPGWVVLTGNGSRIGQTGHPVRWAIAHPHTFRTHTIVKFKRQ